MSYPRVCIAFCHTGTNVPKSNRRCLKRVINKPTKGENSSLHSYYKFNSLSFFENTSFFPCFYIFAFCKTYTCRGLLNLCGGCKSRCMNMWKNDRRISFRSEFSLKSPGIWVGNSLYFIFNVVGQIVLHAFHPFGVDVVYKNNPV